MASKSLIVIGSGPGGNAAALEAAQRGLSVTLIDAQEMGGTCLNRGCIPSKFFLSQAQRAGKEFAPIQNLVDQKNALLATLRQRMEQAAKSAAIKRVTGIARFISPRTIEVVQSPKSEGDLGPRTSDAALRLEADAFILATGSSPVIPPSFPKHPAIFTSDTIFAIDYLPAHLLVIGGGYIGSELACAFQGLGSKVTLVEKEKCLLATQPEFQAAAPVLQRSFEKRGMTVWTGTEVKTVAAIEDRKLTVTCSNGETVEANAVLLSLGRRPNYEALNLPAADISVQGGRFQVNDHLQTCVPTIYAIGDLVSPLPLAHTATKEAEIAIKHLAGEKAEKLNYSNIPRCVYTFPETAAIGLTESQALALGHKTRIDRYHFAASSKAMIEGETDGFWMILSDSDSHKLLGALIVGSHATELIHLIALSLKAGLTTIDLADTVFAHPSLSEGLGEAMRRATASNVRSPKS